MCIVVLLALGRGGYSGGGYDDDDAKAMKMGRGQSGGIRGDLTNKPLSSGLRADSSVRRARSVKPATLTASKPLVVQLQVAIVGNIV